MGGGLGWIFWWTPFLWAGKFPLKIKIFTWLSLKIIILTWDSLCKRGLIGPGYCILYKSDLDLVEHLFGSCTFFKGVWSELSLSFHFEGGWDSLCL